VATILVQFHNNCNEFLVQNESFDVDKQCFKQANSVLVPTVSQRPGHCLFKTNQCSITCKWWVKQWSLQQQHHLVWLLVNADCLRACAVFVNFGPQHTCCYGTAGQTLRIHQDDSKYGSYW